VDHPGRVDPVLRRQVHELRAVLDRPGDRFEAEVRIALLCDGLRQRLAGATEPPGVRRDRPLAHRLRALLDAGVVEGLTPAAYARSAQ
jgi:hypothetical protein